MRYVIAIAENEHFGRAADSLGVKQPALSQQIRALESELGAQLFDRHGRTIHPTAAGEAYLAGARRAVAASKPACRRSLEQSNVNRHHQHSL